MKILIYGYGNPGRQDDGLGPRLVERIEQQQSDNKLFQNVDTDSNYQLNIEDADNINQYDIVIFVDASVSAEPPFEFTGIKPSKDIELSTHAVSPQSVLARCEDIHGAYPKTYLLAIRGHEWEMMIETLSEQAKGYLDAAFEKLQNFIAGLN